MAWGRKKSGGRPEPLFGLPAALADLRLSPADRIPAATDDEKPKKSVSRRKHEEDDDEPPPRERKRPARHARGGPRRAAAARPKAARGQRWRQAAGEIARPVQVRPAGLLGCGSR